MIHFFNTWPRTNPKTVLKSSDQAGWTQHIRLGHFVEPDLQTEGALFGCCICETHFEKRMKHDSFL